MNLVLAVLEDDSMTRYVASSLIERRGITVDQFAHPIEFLKSQKSYSLLLTDYHMPQMTGLQVGQALRARGSQIPIICMSGLPSEIPDKGRFFNALLAKPFDAKELYDILGNYIPLNDLEKAQTQ